MSNTSDNNTDRPNFLERMGSHIKYIYVFRDKHGGFSSDYSYNTVSYTQDDGLMYAVIDSMNESVPVKFRSGAMEIEEGVELLREFVNYYQHDHQQVPDSKIRKLNSYDIDNLIWYFSIFGYQLVIIDK